MHLTTLTIDAPGQLLATHVVADEREALARLRELCPAPADAVPDDELVHALSEQGIRAQILRQDIAHLLTDQADVPSRSAGAHRSPYGDLYRYDSFATSDNARLGQYLRPATAVEAAYSRSSALLDGGLGVFGVHAAPPPGRSGGAGPSGPSGPTVWLESRTTFIHYGSTAWEQALLTSRVRYYRVDAIPAGVVLPPVTGGTFPTQRDTGPR